MPRKDRRFTGQDIARIYCRNLSPAQRAVFDTLDDCSWKEMDSQETAKALVDMLGDRPFTYLWDSLPWGGWAKRSLEAVGLLLEMRPADPGLYLAPFPPEGGPGAG